MPASSKTKASLVVAATIAATAYGSVFSLNSGVRICDAQNNCTQYTAQEYENVKDFLGEKIKNGNVLSWDEYQTMIKIVDHEIKENGGLTVSPVDADTNMRDVIGSILTQ